MSKGIAAPIFMVGLAVIASYYVARESNWSKIGQPSDIGGGFILLVGIALAVLGGCLVVFRGK